MIAALALMVVGGVADPAVLNIELRQVSAHCTMTVNGKSADIRDTKAVDALLAPFDPKIHPVEIKADETMTYRCIGGSIYKLQMRGFQFAKMGYVMSPPATTHPPTR